MTMAMTVSGRGRWIGDRQKRDPRIKGGKRRKARQGAYLAVSHAGVEAASRRVGGWRDTLWAGELNGTWRED